MSDLDPATRRNIRLTVALLLAFVLLVMGGLTYRLSQPRILNPYELRNEHAYLIDPPRPVAGLSLIDQAGQPFTEARLQGHWTLVFFGFTHCNDVCPTTMATLAKMYAELKPGEQKDLQVIFVSVDPERDTPSVLSTYVARFRPDFAGVTGEPARLLKVALEWQTGFAPPVAGGTDYQVEHSGNLVLINPRGELHALLAPPFEHGALRVVLRSLRATF
ncbi:MAG: SCO family protein [Porticoccaceae bacterium]